MLNKLNPMQNNPNPMQMQVNPMQMQVNPTWTDDQWDWARRRAGTLTTIFGCVAAGIAIIYKTAEAVKMMGEAANQAVTAQEKLESYTEKKEKEEADGK